MSLIQRRLGWKPLELFATAMRTLDVIWVDDVIHRDAEEILFSRRRRGITIVDAAAFVVMRALRVNVAFAFDNDFGREGEVRERGRRGVPGCTRDVMVARAKQHDYGE